MTENEDSILSQKYTTAHDWNYTGRTIGDAIIHGMEKFMTWRGFFAFLPVGLFILAGLWVIFR